MGTFQTLAAAATMRVGGGVIDEGAEVAGVGEVSGWSVYQMTGMPSLVKKGCPVTQRGPLAWAVRERVPTIRRRERRRLMAGWLVAAARR